MSAAPVPKPQAKPETLIPPQRIARLCGYGLRSCADGFLFRPTTVDEIREALDLARDTGRQVTLRGAGRSYGDASVGAECVVIDISRMKAVRSWDARTGIIDCEPGVTIEGLWRHCIEDGYWPPVVSGTMYPTLAGALGMNIHGKNNFAAGTLGEHVQALDVLFPNGDFRTLTPQDDLFYDVISGAGLLGIITGVRLQMKRIHSGDVRVLPVSARNWDDQFAAFERFEGEADYMVSWIDCFARGSHAGRGLFHGAWYLDEPEELPATLRHEHQDLPDTILGFFPKSMMWRMLKLFCNRTGMRFLNSAKYMASRLLGDGKPHSQSLVGFSFLLDYVPNWRKAYEPGGFIQYQSFVPKEHAQRVFTLQLEMQQAAKLESFLGVMKRHRPDQCDTGFLFGHAVDGYSLALDFKVTEQNWPTLQRLCWQMNELVLEAGGRFYFAKDSTLRPSDVEGYLGEDSLARFATVKKLVDPDNLLTSDLAKRVGLTR